MKNNRIVLTCVSLAAAMLIASTSGSLARTLDTKMSPDQLRGVCAKNGGNFGNNQRGDGVCLGQGGGAIICHKDRVCTDGDAKMEVLNGFKMSGSFLNDTLMSPPSPSERPKPSAKAGLAAKELKQ